MHFSILWLISDIHMIHFGGITIFMMVAGFSSFSHHTYDSYDLHLMKLNYVLSRLVHGTIIKAVWMCAGFIGDISVNPPARVGRKRRRLILYISSIEKYTRGLLFLSSIHMEYYANFLFCFVVSFFYC